MTGEEPTGDGPTFAVVNAVAAADREQLEAILSARGVAVLTLHGDDAHDKRSFLARVAAELPPIEDLEPHNWDAFGDYFWNVLFDVPGDAVALVWTAAQVMVAGDLTDFLDAVRIVTDVARNVINGEPGSSRPKAVWIFLLGEGSGFRPLSAWG